MGITIKSKNKRAILGYGGFLSFRMKVADLVSPEFGAYYKTVLDGMFSVGLDRDEFFKDFYAKADDFIEKKIITVEVANFLLQADHKGYIKCNQAQQVYEIIKDYNDDLCYGYSGTPDATTFADLKAIIKDCAENDGRMEWS